VNPLWPAGYDRIFNRALAKDPNARFPTAAEFVGELRRALHDDAGDTWVEPPPRTAVTRPVPVAARPASRSRLLAGGLVLAGLLAAGVAAAVLLSRGHDGGTPTTRAVRTVVHTVTSPSQTVRQTITTEAPAAPPPTTAKSTSTSPATSQSTSTAASTSGASGAALNNAGYARQQAGDYAGALPLLQQAVQKLTGTGSLDEAYADYNLAYSTLATGQCTNVLSLLDRSQAIQGHRPQIEHLRHEARKSCR
jgi:hypothetical protein